MSSVWVEFTAALCSNCLTVTRMHVQGSASHLDDLRR